MKKFVLNSQYRERKEKLVRIQTLSNCQRLNQQLAEEPLQEEPRAPQSLRRNLEREANPYPAEGKRRRPNGCFEGPREGAEDEQLKAPRRDEGAKEA